MPRGGDEDLPAAGLDGLEGPTGVEPEAAARLLAAARAAFARIEKGEGTLAALEAALAGPSPAPLLCGSPPALLRAGEEKAGGAPYL